MAIDKSTWSLGPPMNHLGVSDGDHLTDLDTAESLIYRSAFDFSPPKRVGVELEWLVHDGGDPMAPVHPDRTTAALNDLDVDGILSIEPGGQLELSSAPADLGDCLRQSMADMTAIRRILAAAGLTLTGVGIDPGRPPRRYLRIPRYDAMEEAFNRTNESGRLMLCSTASVQVSLDAGTEHDFRARWEGAHAIGPVLVAAFANSPIHRSRSTGWRSTRQAAWLSIDRSRSAPPTGSADPRTAWARYALDARVICVRRRDGLPWTAPDGLSFKDWVVERQPRVPTVGDLRYHLSTLFPPIRPRGYLELRMIDAQRGDDWVVPVAVVKALLDDEKALDAAMEATEPLHRGGASRPDPWVGAARTGLADPSLAAAAYRCFEAAHAALIKADLQEPFLGIVERFIECYVSRGRSPADDVK
ncbi:ergothioneine biosynthesis glutamate--cysteine ligase EgtA [Nonomuraea sp. NPDC050663]|uniref:ergothioneine biosynthesis glutamate--cysteine ligase EgtA n=1 Tax=Nonomuraea sp. NPDC050663 TaxID=3364370 RepID=UPI0037B52506